MLIILVAGQHNVYLKKIMKGTRTAKWDSSVDENMKYGGSDD